MKYRVQCSPISGTRDSYPDQLSRERGSFNLQEPKFFRSWLVYDSNLEGEEIPGRLQWNMLLGLALAVTVSATFWVGVGLMIERLWR